MKLKCLSLLLIAGISANAQQKMDLHAHRGGMALMPENTIPAMLNAVKMGAKTLELDVVISKDEQVVVSHDAYMSANFMRKPNGQDISKSEERSLSLYQMDYDSIKRYDAGTKPHPMFPNQQKMKVYRPLLSELIDSVENYVAKNKLKPVYYNIETKCSPAGDGIYHPNPEVFVNLLLNTIQNKKIENRVIIQSFDTRTLKILHQIAPKIQLSLLVQGNMKLTEEKLKNYGLSAKEVEAYFANLKNTNTSLETTIANLGFTPNYYSPYFGSVDPKLVKEAHALQMKVLPWTVNSEADMLKLAKLGVDGIISDQPDLLIKLFGSYQK